MNLLKINNQLKIINELLETKYQKNYKPIIRKLLLEKRTVYSVFKGNIWGADLADMQLMNKFNKGIRFLLCVIGIFSKYGWVVPLKDKGVTIVNLFQKILERLQTKQDMGRQRK